MRGRVVCGVLILAGFAAGCSDYGLGMQGANIGMNLAKDSTYLRIELDGHDAEQNTLKKAYSGYSDWKVKEQVSETPKLKFEITKPDKLGRITMVTVSIFQGFNADYSHQPEFTIVARSTDPESQMKPNTVYDLGNPGSGFRVSNLANQEVTGVTLKPGMKYKLVLTVKADKSESAQVEFKTN